MDDLYVETVRVMDQEDVHKLLTEEMSTRNGWRVIQLDHDNNRFLTIQNYRFVDYNILYSFERLIFPREEKHQHIFVRNGNGDYVNIQKDQTNFKTTVAMVSQCDSLEDFLENHLGEYHKRLVNTYTHPLLGLTEPDAALREFAESLCKVTNYD